MIANLESHIDSLLLISIVLLVLALVFYFLAERLWGLSRVFSALLLTSFGMGIITVAFVLNWQSPLDTAFEVSLNSIQVMLSIQIMSFVVGTIVPWATRIWGANRRIIMPRWWQNLNRWQRITVVMGFTLIGLSIAVISQVWKVSGDVPPQLALKLSLISTAVGLGAFGFQLLRR